MMKLLAPVNTFQSAVDLINAGAEEIYLGGDDELFKVYSFTGRGKIASGGITVLSKFPQVKEIVDYAHSRDVRVNFTANTQFFYNGNYRNRNLESYFIDYVEKAIDSGVDAIIIGDIGLLKLIYDKKYPVKLHASIYFKTINHQQVLFLKEFGVSRVTLSYHVTLEEIINLCKDKSLEYEVVGYLGCSFYNGACSFLHAYGECVYDDFDPGVACKGLYFADNGVKSERSKIFDVEAGCALCKLGILDSIGVEALKIVGRDRSHANAVEVVKLYKGFLAQLRNDQLETDNKLEIPSWWKRIYCSKKSCKYSRENPNYVYVIGR